jgi:hypothetical protein
VKGVNERSAATAELCRHVLLEGRKEGRKEGRNKVRKKERKKDRKIERKKEIGWEVVGNATCIENKEKI